MPAPPATPSSRTVAHEDAWHRSERFESPSRAHRRASPVEDRAMKIVIVGASRGVGRHAVEQALRLRYDVTAVARKTGTLQDLGGRVNTVAGDATSPSDIERSRANHDAVLCTLGADDRRGAATLYSTAARTLVDAMPRA